jgi:hypothetical protein
MKKSKFLITLFSISILLSCGKEETNSPPILEDVTISQRFGGRGFNIGYLIATLQAKDVDEDVLIYSIISQTPNNSITVSSTTGEVFVQNVDSFEYDLNKQVTAVIKVSDGNSDITANLTINIEDPN